MDQLHKLKDKIYRRLIAMKLAVKDSRTHAFSDYIAYTFRMKCSEA